ncbi:extracellular solute-binding protein [Carnobacterium sp.]|uniref:extracellular solute-binding protein n=1 Tax=Carnobacterium sp. TaxID=48221 RepID=UPI0028A8668B|nr:extracellular solute-binding protein [Carnobacterium sp.]
MKLKKMKLVAAGLCSMLLLAACGGAEDASNDSSSKTGSQEVDKKQELVVYTNANSDGRGEWLEKEAKDAGFNITLVGAGGTDVTNRLVSEKSNPIADVVYGLNSMLYEQLKEEDVLEKYVPTWADEVEEGVNDPEGYYHGLIKQALLLSYNPDVYNEKTAPQSYIELAEDNTFKGKYEAPTQLDQVTPRIILSSILVQYKDEDGEMGVSDEGWKMVENFLKNGIPTPEGEDFYSLLASKKVPIGTLVSGTLQAKEDQYGVAAKFVNPKAGSPLIVEQAAIIKGGKKTALAQEFVDWLGSTEVQGKFASEFNAMPANTKAAEQATDYVKDLYSNITTQTLDWNFISKHIDEWMEKVELELL